MGSLDFGFVKMIEDEVFCLPRILTQRLPKASQLYNMAVISLSCKFKENAVFFRYDGLDTDNTCIASCIETEPMDYWCILSPNTTCDETLVRILQKFVELVNWSKSVSFNSVDKVILNHLLTACGEKEGFSREGTENDTYYMPIQDALSLNSVLPPGLSRRSLRDKDATIIFGNWKFTDISDVDFTWEGAMSLESAGLEVDGALVSWGMNMRDGAIHIVHTLEEYRGQGHAKLLMKELCKVTAQSGKVPVVHVEDYNETSRRLMTSVGFKFSHSNCWTDYIRNA